MKGNIYTMKILCKKLDQPRQKVRRRLIKLDIKAINEYTRNYENEPLEYDHQTFLKLAEEFDVQIQDEECTANVQQCTAKRTASVQQNSLEENDKDKLIEVLENQLEEANKSRANLEKLLDQQQQLTMISNKKLELLKLEFKDLESNQEKELKSEKYETNETKKWWQFWK